MPGDVCIEKGGKRKDGGALCARLEDPEKIGPLLIPLLLTGSSYLRSRDCMYAALLHSSFLSSLSRHSPGL